MTMDRKHQADRGRRRSDAASASVEGSEFVNRIVDRAAGGDFLDQTIAVWQPYADHALTREDAREMVHNVVGFFRVLREWAEEERRDAAAAESSPPSIQLGDAESNGA
ncbi:hypothetical protein NLM33_41790 [Bradyrhizobium sp. CCGUVB1N3]|uniref:hypothetical protein n=1 Tax=Bradyrhizobium sp. CCGUVB1N3 TaxID=2949629 RepID=UPI0020B2F6D2|nr:hypothetical protein [Bradyrhizobium sp. CCGUVB1N3]MCP3476698.1 hypothetical protein [Bradyrhizobium sp. CCGUVB1N3]